MKTMFVRNLAPDTTEEDVRELFSQYGTVRDVKLSTDMFSGKCRGFGLVDMEGHEARAAMAALDGRQFKGKDLRVGEDKPRAKRSGRRR
jgi:RNA recognition motif-containing protein